MDFAQKSIHRGNKNVEITKGFEKIAAAHEVSLADGVLSHQLKRFVIDGSKVILLKPQPDQSVEEFAFDDFEVFAIDIVVTTGKGNFRFVSFLYNSFLNILPKKRNNTSSNNL